MANHSSLHSLHPTPRSHEVQFHLLFRFWWVGLSPGWAPSINLRLSAQRDGLYRPFLARLGMVYACFMLYIYYIYTLHINIYIYYIYSIYVLHGFHMMRVGGLNPNPQDLQEVSALFQKKNTGRLWAVMRWASSLWTASNWAQTALKKGHLHIANQIQRNH